jgi:hypothetical protein
VAGIRARAKQAKARKNVLVYAPLCTFMAINIMEVRIQAIPLLAILLQGKIEDVRNMTGHGDTETPHTHRRNSKTIWLQVNSRKVKTWRHMKDAEKTVPTGL